MLHCKPAILAATCLAGLVWATPVGALGARREVQVMLDGIPYRPVQALADAHHMAVAPPRQPGDPVLLTHALARVALYPDSRRSEINGTLVLLNAPVLRSRGRLYVAATDVDTILQPLLRPGPLLRTVGHRRVLLDPGHGGQDSGTLGLRGTREKDLVLDLAVRVAQFLTAARVEVSLTRTSDRAVPLEHRTRAAVDTQADLMVSIHLNSVGTGTASPATGIETYVLPAAGFPTTPATARPSRTEPYPGNRFDIPSTILGHAVHRSALAQTQATDRGLKRARFQLLRDAPCPTILIEAGFLSHTEEEKRLNDPAYREKLARGIALGILDYLAAIKRSRLEDAAAATEGQEP